MGAGQQSDHLGELLVNVFRVGLGEDSADDRRDHILAAFQDDGELVALEMNPAPLPGRALENGPDRFLQAVSVRQTSRASLRLTQAPHGGRGR